MIYTKTFTDAISDSSYRELTELVAKKVERFINSGDYIFLDFSYQILESAATALRIVTIVVVYRKPNRDGTAPNIE